MQKSTNADDYQFVADPIAGMPKTLGRGTEILPHRHPRAQLTWAASGVMTVTAEDGSWVVPPQRALWIPAGVTHSIRMSGPVEMRGLYIEPAVAAGIGERCKVVLMSGLLRELILEVAAAPVDAADPSGRMAHMTALILDELRTSAAQPLHLPLPRDARLRAACAAILANPGRPATLDDWAETAGVSGRTLARLFAAETGMRFTEWRQQARLAEAMARLSQGEPVSAVALTLGYGSASAFTAMFGRILGTSPRAYFTAADARS